MKQAFLLLGFLVTLILLNSNTFAAPAPWGIAIKEGTNECAGYWGGDEFVAYGLPDGWTAYYPEFIDGGGYDRIVAGDKSCHFAYGDEKACCEEMGYTYVSENIGKDGDIVISTLYPTGNKPPLAGGLVDPLVLLAVCLVCGLVLGAGIIAVVIIIKRKKS